MPIYEKDTKFLFPISVVFLIAGLIVIWFSLQWGMYLIVMAAVIAYPWFLSVKDEEDGRKS